jgi:hypothetical protein
VNENKNSYFKIVSALHFAPEFARIFRLFSTYTPDIVSGLMDSQQMFIGCLQIYVSGPNSTKSRGAYNFLLDLIIEKLAVYNKTLNNENRNY